MPRVSRAKLDSQISAEARSPETLGPISNLLNDPTVDSTEAGTSRVFYEPLPTTGRAVGVIQFSFLKIGTCYENACCGNQYSYKHHLNFVNAYLDVSGQLDSTSGRTQENKRGASSK